MKPSPKEYYKCPFRISYRYVKFPYNKKIQIPYIYYRVNITSAVYEHTCPLTTKSHREVIQRSGCYQTNINGIQDIISMLRIKPNMECNDLRHFLYKYLPLYKSTNSVFICNFRLRVNNWIFNNPKDSEPTSKTVYKLIQSNGIAAEEEIIDDSPLYRQNLQYLYR